MRIMRSRSFPSLLLFMLTLLFSGFTSRVVATTADDPYAAAPQAPPTFTVTPSAGPHGTISPSTVQTVNNNDDLTFTATPDTGYVVDTWSLDGTAVQTGGTSYTLAKIKDNHTVNVTFKITTFTVTPSAGANGTITPSTAQTVNYNGSQAFTATPNTGYVVDIWTIDGSTVQTGGTSFTLSNVTANHTVNVTFKVATFTITPSAGANGSITPSTVQTVNYNGSQAFTATPDTGYVVDTWSVDSTAVQTGGTSYTLSNITANHTVEVTFKVATFTVTPSAGTNGSITPSTAQTVNYNGSQAFTATPNTGYVVDTWSLDGTAIQTGGTSYTLSNITANHTVDVTFKITTFTITPSAGANGSITPSTAQTVNYNGSQAFTATPDTGYVVDTWSVDSTAVQTGGTSFTLSNITANHTVNVTFKVATFTVTPSAGANGAITPSIAQTVNYNGSQAFTATPDTGYVVDTWSVDGTAVQTGGTSYTLSNVTANHTVEVTFKVATFTVTPSAGANGAITPSTAQTVNYNGSQAFTAMPQSGFEVGTWSVDGTPVQTGGTSFTLSNITADHTVSVTFTATGAQLTLTSDPADIVPLCSPVTLTATYLGAGPVTYRFYYKLGHCWLPITGRQCKNTCTWIPILPGTYPVRVEVFAAGQMCPIASDEITLTVTWPLSAVCVQSLTPAPYHAGNAIDVQAKTIGGAQVLYQFTVLAFGHPPITGPVSPDPAWQWIPPTPGIYQVIVTAREVSTGRTVKGTMLFIVR